MKLGTLFALAVLSAPLIASAADDLSGPYAGLYYGGVNGSDNGVEYDATFPPPATDGYTQETKPSGKASGLTVGYSWLIEDQLLLGLEANYERRSVRGTSLQQFYGAPDPTFPFKTESEAARSLLARVGFAFNEGRTAVYTSAGYMSVSLRRTLSDNTTGTSTQQTEWVGGWTAGLGMEHLLIDHLAVMADYRFNQYKDSTFDVDALFANLYERQSYDEHQLRVGVTVRF